MSMCLFCSKPLHSENLFQQLHADNQHVDRIWKRNLANFQSEPGEISEFSLRMEHCAIGYIQASWITFEKLISVASHMETQKSAVCSKAQASFNDRTALHLQEMKWPQKLWHVEAVEHYLCLSLTRCHMTLKVALWAFPTRYFMNMKSRRGKQDHEHVFCQHAG